MQNEEVEKCKTTRELHLRREIGVLLFTSSGGINSVFAALGYCANTAKFPRDS